MQAFLSTAYLAPIQYYTKLLSSESVYIEQHENYIKQTYRNRCSIVSANGPIPLSIPVIHSSSQKTLTKDIRIAEHGNWQHMHWNAIVSAYNSTPFFEYYQDDFYPFYHKKIEYLFDFNNELQFLILRLLNITDVSIKFTEDYKTIFSEGQYDFREIIHPKKDWRNDSHFQPTPYYQVFDHKLGFQPNMSIIDLLFNMGNESLLVLRDSTR